MKSPESGNRPIEISRVTSLGPSAGESAPQAPQPSPLAAECCLELLRDVATAFSTVLINAQVLDGKLPSYSRSKRYIHEIERSAQRGGALLKRLLDRLSTSRGDAGDTEFESGRVPPVAERTAVVASQGPNAVADGALSFVPSVAAHAAPDFVPRVADAHSGV